MCAWTEEGGRWVTREGKRTHSSRVVRVTCRALPCLATAEHHLDFDICTDSRSSRFTRSVLGPRSRVCNRRILGLKSAVADGWQLSGLADQQNVMLVILLKNAVWPWTALRSGWPAVVCLHVQPDVTSIGVPWHSGRYANLEWSHMDLVHAT